MSLVSWRNGQDAPQVNGWRNVPRKPVIWHGELWLKLPDGTKVSQTWRARQKIRGSEAIDVVRALLNELVAENGTEAIDSGFWIQSR